MIADMDRPVAARGHRKGPLSPMMRSRIGRTYNSGDDAEAPDKPLAEIETGFIGIPYAILNTACNALHADHTDMPLTPEAAWRALQHR
ncbi:hypothetical protein [Streptosporangium sp. NPDC087985]|uniref:hypothetical protein n=1 Tax=Streptosporangium sp. NPDC087985 TaxID=3366196 RepID=UPI0037FB8082